MDIDIKKLKTFEDDRGTIFELLRREHLDRTTFGHLFYVTFKNNKSIRGNHYHKKSHEFYFVLRGSVSLVLEDVRLGKKNKFELSEKDKSVLRIGPYIAHASHSLSADAILLAYNTLPYKDEKPDTYRHIILKK